MACGGGLDRKSGEGLEVAVGADVTGDGVEPDLAGGLPGVAAEGGRNDVEGLVGDAGVDVDAAVVVLGVDVVTHVARLRVLAQARVVVGRAGGSHRADRHTLDVGAEQFGADEPVGLVRALAEQALLDEHPEDVGDRLVERARLVLVVQARGELGDAVRELVADDVDAAGERQEDHAVTVAEDHLGAVPEGVVVVAAEVHRGDEGQASAVERVAAVGVLPEVPGGAEPVVGLADLAVTGVGVALAAHEGAGQGGAPLGVVDGALRGVGRAACRARRSLLAPGCRSGGAQLDAACLAQLGVDVEGGLGVRGDVRVVGGGQRLEDVRRHDRAQRRVGRRRVLSGRHTASLPRATDTRDPKRVGAGVSRGRSA